MAKQTVLPSSFPKNPNFGRWNISEKDKAAYARNGGKYALGPNSKPRSGVPTGAISANRMDDCTVYPGVAHDYWIYVPQRYKASETACLMVFLDGESFLDVSVNAAVMLDNLTHQEELPVMIGLFINAGPAGPGYPIYGGSDNRSIEYDSTNANYAKFLLDDVLPTLHRSYNISSDPACRGIAGCSSGGHAAFTVAWERPEAFRKVISLVGSFVDIRGGNRYPSLIRKSARKPLRVFLQDGTMDLDTVFGNWPIANQDLAAALAYRDYDYKIEFGDGGHSICHGASILPHAMRWLWRK
jgi:enterochelin esterase-like enzyme